MNLPLFIAHRIYRDNDSGKQVSRPAVLIAMIGIAIGLAGVVVNGCVIVWFQKEGGGQNLFFLPIYGARRSLRI